MDSAETFDVFYRENRDRLFSYLYRLTGERQLARDLMQESFARYLSRYGPARGSGALLYTIARNAAMDAFRQRGRVRQSVAEPVSDCGTPEHHVIQKQACDRVQAALERLGADDRELLSLVVAKELSYRKIGLLLGISEGNVKVRVHRARMALQKILDGGKV